MKTKNLLLIILALSLVSLGIYLFVSAPPPLDLNSNKEKKHYSIEEGLKILSNFNDGARTFYTKQIVGKGLAVGLDFHEDWEKENVEAGPLPALFLRGTASYLEKSPVPLGLYLGSDYPIVKANLFEGMQAEKFKEMRKDKKPKFFYDADTERYIGMFPDFAGAQACVTCHNEHKNTPKDNWNLNDLMGATTWSYPTDSLSTDELMAMIDVYKKGVSNTYDSYLKEIETFNQKEKPYVGKFWPVDGYYIPSLEVFNDTLSKLSSEAILKGLLKE